MSGERVEWKLILTEFLKLPLPAPREHPAIKTKRLLSWLAFADAAVRDIDQARPITRPARPTLVPESNEETLAVLKVYAKRGTNAAKEIRDVANEFMEWREQLLNIEQQNTMRCSMLLRTLRTFDAVPDAGESFLVQVRIVRAALRDWYGLEPEKPYAPTHVDLLVTAANAARDRELVPAWLLRAEDPPGRFVPPRATPREAEEEQER